MLLLLLKYLKQITQTLKLDLEEEQQLVIVAHTVKHLTCVSKERGDRGGKEQASNTCVLTGLQRCTYASMRCCVLIHVSVTTSSSAARRGTGRGGS